MKKLKVILPMLAFVLAIGLSFAYVKADNAVLTAYVNDSGTWIAVDVDCPGNGSTCKVQFVDENGAPLSAVLDVYPIPAFEDENGNPVEPLESSAPTPEFIEI